jgi:serine/threonine-protein kinase SRPK3
VYYIPLYYPYVIHSLHQPGSWRGETKLPNSTLEKTAGKWDVGNHVEFLAFLRKMICWKPEERFTAKQLLEDSWLNAS